MRRFVPLESLRGIAALMVVMFHAVGTNPITGLRLLQNGPLMVDFFFVLSGFVICYSYGDRLSGRHEIGTFLWLRLGRLYPLHFAMLLVFLGFELAKLIAEQRLGIVADKPAFSVNNGFALLTNLLLMQSLGMHHSLTFNYPSWSISTEFYAYVLFALVRAWTGTGTRYMVAAAAIVVAGFGILPAVGVHTLQDAGYDWGFFRCCGGFFLGTLVWHAYDSIRQATAGQPAPRWMAGLVPAVLIVSVVFLSLADPHGPVTYLFPWLAALIVLTVVCWPEYIAEHVLTVRPLTYLGKISYSIYMVHAAFVWIFTQVLTVVFKFPKIEVADEQVVGTPLLVGLAVLVVYVALVVVASGFTYRFIEEPFRRRSRELAHYVDEIIGGAPHTPASGPGNPAAR